eukprot:TRINITY_DN5787_c0_g1_i1.p1 TRINITY_DN5787_c0_g1~~TRINITY_DN5787_c0_g1_i1.p1  ORF type:complete len:442 (-),score=87.91 TRINITY_DN5787_c0_g1_i1:44-1369(-)
MKHCSALYFAVLVLLFLAIPEQNSVNAFDIRTYGDVIPNDWIIVLDESITSLQMYLLNAWMLARDLIPKEFNTSSLENLNLLSLVCNITDLLELNDAIDISGIIKFIEQNQVFRKSVQTNPPSGLDRIDQRNLPLDKKYSSVPTGAGVDVYILDSSVFLSHQDFGGRATFGYSAFDVERLQPCDGHGTHVAGIVAGATYGVAKEANIISVEVLDCQGQGDTVSLVNGINYILDQKSLNPQKPAITVMSLGGGASTLIDTAVRNLVDNGVVVVVAAGNNNEDACNTSPAREPSVLTVGAMIPNRDEKSSFSNFGSCVDVFAPGSDIESAWITSDTSSEELSGTSMSAPHVAGVAALVLGEYPSLSAYEVAAFIVNNATSGVLDKIGAGSPNLLLSSQILPPPPSATIVPTTDFQPVEDSSSEISYVPNYLLLWIASFCVFLL